MTKETNFKWDDKAVVELAEYISTHTKGIVASVTGDYTQLINDFKQSKGKELHKGSEEPTNDELVRLLRDCVSSTWGNPSLDKTQVLFDKFLHDRNLAKPSKELINSFITDAVNRNIYDKKYSQSEVDTIRDETWEAARNAFKVQIPNGGLGYSDLQFKYPTIQDYLNSINENKIERIKEKPQLHDEIRTTPFRENKPSPETLTNTVTDNSDVVCLSLNDFSIWYERWYPNNPMKAAFLHGLKELVKQKLKQ